MNAVNKSLANTARTTLLASEDFMPKAKIFTIAVMAFCPHCGKNVE